MTQTIRLFEKTAVSLLGGLCGIGFMLIFLITAVEAVAYWTPGYYEKEYTKYQVLDDLPEMSMEDLLDVTDEMMAYLRGRREDLHVFSNIGGEQREFFNEREIAHMEDVRGLFIGGLWLRRAGILLVLLCLIGALYWKRGNSFRSNFLKRRIPLSLCVGSGVFFMAAACICGIISTDFSKYFIVFHEIFFDNDLWLLDPRTDLLINIVPEPFFMDTALRIGILFFIMAAVFLILNFFLWKKASAASRAQSA